MLGTFPAVSLFVLTPHFNLFSDSVSDTDTTGLSNHSHSIRLLSAEVLFIVVWQTRARYSRAVLHLKASSAILNRPPQKSLQETLPPPPNPTL